MALADYGNLKVNPQLVKTRNLMKPSNSTSTLYTLDSTISHPSNRKLIHCVSEYFHALIHAIPQETVVQSDPFEIFDEMKHPLKLTLSDMAILRRVPDPPTVEDFASHVFSVGDMSPESLILVVGYIDRVLKKSSLKIYSFNWKRVFLSCLILSSKVWEDLSVWNTDFSPMSSATDLRDMEWKLLEILQYDVAIKSSEYATLYFNLRAQYNSKEDFKELNPLDKDGEERLELRTSTYFERVKARLVHSDESGSFPKMSAAVLKY